MFLNQNDLRQLTGKSRYKAQIRWLRANGWRFTVNTIGAPVVANAEASRKLVGGVQRSQEPNWEKLNGSAA